VKRRPPRPGDLEAQRGRQVAEPSAPVAEQVAAHDLEDMLAAAGVDVADVAELAEAHGLDARLLGDLAQGRLLRFLPRADEALRKRPDARRLPSRPDRGEDEAPA